MLHNSFKTLTIGCVLTLSACIPKSSYHANHHYHRADTLRHDYPDHEAIVHDVISHSMDAQDLKRQKAKLHLQEKRLRRKQQKVWEEEIRAQQRRIETRWNHHVQAQQQRMADIERTYTRLRRLEQEKQRAEEANQRLQERTRKQAQQLFNRRTTVIPSKSYSTTPKAHPLPPHSSATMTYQQQQKLFEDAAQKKREDERRRLAEINARQSQKRAQDRARATGPLPLSQKSFKNELAAAAAARRARQDYNR